MSRHPVQRDDDDLGTAPLAFVLGLFALLLLVHMLQT